MKKSPRKLIDQLVEIGIRAYEMNMEIDQPIEGTVEEIAEKLKRGEIDTSRIHEIQSRFGRMYIDKEENTVWREMKDSDSIETFLNMAIQEKDIKFRKEALHRFIREFIHEIIEFGLTFPDRHRDRDWVKNEIEIMARAFIEGCVSERTNYGFFIPLHNLVLDSFEFPIGKYGRIRRSYYDEKEDFGVRFPDAIHPIGFEKCYYTFEYSNFSGSPIDFKNFGMHLTIVYNLIMALRLVYGGGIGFDFVHAWKKPTQELKIGGTDFESSNTQRAPPYIYPCARPTDINNTKLRSRLLDAMERLDNQKNDPYLYRALRRYGTAQQTDYIDDKILDSIIALEWLFKGSKKGIMRSFKVISTFTKNNDTLDFLQECWNARHKVAHGNSLEFKSEIHGVTPESAAERLQHYVRLCLLYVVFKSPISREELHAHLDGNEIDKISKALIIKGPVSKEDFDKMEIRIGRIMNCKQIEGSNKLLELDVDFVETHLITVATLAKKYKPGELVGLSVIIVVNIESQTICGVESTGLILTIESSEEDCYLLPIIDSEIPIGSRVG